MKKLTGFIAAAGMMIALSACTGKSILKFCNNGTDIIEWFHILVGIGEKYGKSSDCQSASRHK